MQILLIGASGGVGSLVVEEGLRRGHRFTAQSRTGATIPAAEQVTPLVCSPTDAIALGNALPGHDAAVFALGIDHLRPTTLFSDSTAVLLRAVKQAQVRRLVVVTGVGAGETRGHGGFLYDRLLFPLFTRHRYADKERQEELVESSGLDWTIVRPAPFKEGAASSPLEIVTEVRPETRLTRISRREVALFILDGLEGGTYIRQKPFIGHRR